MPATASIIQLPADSSGKKVAAATYTEGGQTVYAQVFVQGEPYLASYVLEWKNISTATLADHIIQIMAGAGNAVRIHRIAIEQRTNATASGLCEFLITRLTSAGTGGTVVTPAKDDPGDAAAGATGMTLPTVKGGLGVELRATTMVFRQTVAAAGAQVDDGFEWTQAVGMKPIVIPAGVTNGIAVINNLALAGSTVSGIIEFSESTF